MKFKQNVNVYGVRPELQLAIIVANDVFRNVGLDMTITSIADGMHSKTSLHYTGCAFDARTRGIHGTTLGKIVAELNAALTDDYDVVRESDHLHIEYQPKRRDENT